MLSTEQAKNITFVFSKLLVSEKETWDDMDNLIEMLDFLDDRQICIESEVLSIRHSNLNMGCPIKHTGDLCFVKNILEAVESIVELYKETGNLHPNNRYILSYYLAFYQSGYIIEV